MGSGGQHELKEEQRQRDIQVSQNQKNPSCHERKSGRINTNRGLGYKRCCRSEVAETGCRAFSALAARWARRGEEAELPADAGLWYCIDEIRVKSRNSCSYRSSRIVLPAPVSKSAGALVTEAVDVEACLFPAKAHSQMVDASFGRGKGQHEICSSFSLRD
ncbi:unnamed protein product [Protopolystoma xenopodis]|uniref:Uncharacterized protein n=1 Tax=Protopolystoma xenopodis TaxID=117903 RepID=A0A3S5BKM4_9PLAT|nr:unnamed protein product [Protopolystoma xenopodis]